MDKFELSTGGIKSPPDPRDYKLEVLAASVLPEVLPDQVFLDVQTLPVWMQNQLGACVGHAWAKSQQHCEFLETGTIKPLSSRFLYAVSKCLDGYPGEGTYPRITAKVMQKFGVPTEVTCVNDTLLPHEEYVYHRDITKIPKHAMDEAQLVTIDGYGWADLTEDGIKKAIHYAKIKRQGVVMLMRVGDTFWKDKDGNSTWDKNKILPIRRPTTITSGHEVFPIGYEYKNGRLAVHFLNSWSKDWADNGKGWFYWDEWTGLIDEIMTSIDKGQLPAFQFSKSLWYGLTDPDVLELQKKLNKLGYIVSPTGAGSPGNETTFFGAKTTDAVKRFQKAQNIIQTGYFGVLTRTAINKL